MKRYLAVFFFIASFNINSINAHAQNLTQMVTKPVATSAITSAQTESTEIAESLNSPLVNIEVIGMRLPLFNYRAIPKPPKTLLATAEEINREAIFQRKRFDETGQPIVMERDHLYYRRDAYSYTKGLILYKFLGGMMDFGIYRSHFSPANTNLSGKLTQDYGQQSSNATVFRNGARVFFAVRMRIPTP